MLVLSRFPQQKICIGKDITITIVKIRGDCVVIGINAPKEIRVMRSEIVNPDQPVMPTPGANPHE